MLGLHLLLRSRDRSRLVFMEVVPVGIAALAASFAIDRIFYGSWTFVMANFARYVLRALFYSSSQTELHVRFNFGGGACPGAAMYGTSAFPSSTCAFQLPAIAYVSRIASVALVCQ